MLRRLIDWSTRSVFLIALGVLGILFAGVWALRTTPLEALPDLSDVQVIVQAEAVAVTIVWSGVVAFLAYKISDILVGMRVPEEEEREGLDITAHGESAYN